MGKERGNESRDGKIEVRGKGWFVTSEGQRGGLQLRNLSSVETTSLEEFQNDDEGISQLSGWCHGYRG